jgi:hypothetical protein
MRGGCGCGQVRYSANSELVLTAVCHCKNCQRQSGTAFAVLVGIPRSAVSVQGALKTFQGAGDSGKGVCRRFCPECGSQIIFESDSFPDLTFIQGGTLDDTSVLDPKMHVWCDSAQSWVQIPEGAQRFAKEPRFEGTA